MKSDAELVAAALAGGPEAFAAIVERYQDAVFGVALARLRNFHDAQDVAQTAFVEAYERLAGLKAPGRLGAWLRSIAIHRSIDWLRKRRDAVDLGTLDETVVQTEHAAESKRADLREEVLAAIGRLSKVQRETVTLFYINGYSVAEVAAMQEVPVGTIKGRLHDAREKLKEQLISAVERTLKSEAPKDDFARRVFAMLDRHSHGGGSPYQHLGWGQMVAELRKIGGQGIEGFARALASRHSPTRILAANLLTNVPVGDLVIEIAKKALGDPNRKVRRFATGVLMDGDAPPERKRREFVPLLPPLLSDPSKRVRRAAACTLIEYPETVPIEAVMAALLAERDSGTRLCLERLAGAVLAAKKDVNRKWR